MAATITSACAALVGSMNRSAFFAIIVIYVIPVLRPVPLYCAQTLARIASERKWVVAVYIVTAFIALPALVIILVGVL
jgi:sodium-dependent phosphate cotransporter